MTFRECIVVHSVRLARDSFFTREHAALHKICFNFYFGVILDMTFDLFLGLKKPYVHRVPTFLGCSLLFGLCDKFKRLWSDYIAEANPYPSLTGANPLLANTGTLGCWVSPLARCVPP